MTLLAGFMIALSAEIGLRMGLLGSFMSMITTWACSPTFSLMQMNLSDSIVRVLNPMFAGLMPKFWSWKRKKKRFSIMLLLQYSHEKLFWKSQEIKGFMHLFLTTQSYYTKWQAHEFLCIFKPSRLPEEALQHSNAWCLGFKVHL